MSAAEGGADDGKSRHDELKQKAANVTALVRICGAFPLAMTLMTWYEKMEHAL